MEWRRAKEWIKDADIPCTNCDELDCGGLCSTKEAVDTLVEIVEKVEELSNNIEYCLDGVKVQLDEILGKE